eukprot:1157570-Pelagomonas_calceolata.AAC.15
MPQGWPVVYIYGVHFCSQQGESEVYGVCIYMALAKPTHALRHSGHQQPPPLRLVSADGAKAPQRNPPPDPTQPFAASATS